MSEELDALEGEAFAVDTANAPEVMPSPEEQQQAVAEQQAAVDAVNEEAELIGLLTIAAAMASPMFPSIAKIYTPETIQNIAAAAVPVMQKHGWSAGGLFGKYAEEFTLLVVLAPVTWATYKGIKQDIANADEAAEKAEREEAAPRVEKPVENAMPIFRANEVENVEPILTGRA